MKKTTKELIQYQMINLRSEKLKYFWDIVREYNCDSIEWAFVVGYLAGKIDGKRMDRARRAKSREAQNTSKGGAEQ